MSDLTTPRSIPIVIRIEGDQVPNLLRLAGVAELEDGRYRIASTGEVLPSRFHAVQFAIEYLAICGQHRCVIRDPDLTPVERFGRFVC
jgi:hypothetical protein